MHSVGVQRPVGFEHLGYGTFGLNLVKGLRELGFHVVEPKDIEGYRQSPEGLRTVIWTSVPGHASNKREGQLCVLFSMWETQHLPPPFTANLYNFDTILVPNDLNVEQFSAWNDNVIKVPLGYDSTFWVPQDRVAPTDEFYFLFCGAGAAPLSRKGTELVIEGFERAFPKWTQMSPKPRILVKSLVKSVEPRPYMIVNEGQCSVDELLGLYRRAHAMILPSHGEGWGYHPQQAVATGLPTIVSDIPGHTEYNHLPGFCRLPVHDSKALPFLYGDAGNWWSCDLDDVVQAYRDIYDNYERWCEQAAIGAKEMVRYDHLNMAYKTVDAIGIKNLVQVETGNLIYFKDMEYRVTVNKNLPPGDCNVAGVPYVLYPGNEYWVPANVRQVLEEAGYLGNPGEYVGRKPTDVSSS